MPSDNLTTTPKAYIENSTSDISHVVILLYLKKVDHFIGQTVDPDDRYTKCNPCKDLKFEWLVTDR